MKIVYSGMTNSCTLESFFQDEKITKEILDKNICGIKELKKYNMEKTLIRFAFFIEDSIIILQEKTDIFISNILNNTPSKKINSKYWELLVQKINLEFDLLNAKELIDKITEDEETSVKYQIYVNCLKNNIEFSMQRFERYIEVDTSNFRGCTMNINELGEVITDKIQPIFEFNNFNDFFNFLLIEFENKGKKIRKCANCNKYFIPMFRSDTIYCDNISPQDTSKTCKEYGSINTYQENLKTNEAMGLYRKIYMQKQMATKRNPDKPEYLQDFENFKKESKEWKAKVKNEEKTEAEYIQWLKSLRKE